MIEVFAAIGFAVVLVAAAWLDVRTRRIPNALTLAGLAVALLPRALPGPPLLMDGVKGAGWALLLGIGLFVIRAIGGGDAKLLMAVGAFAGASRLLGVLAAIAIAGAVAAVLTMARQGTFLLLLHNTLGLARALASRGRAGPPATLESPGALTIPFGVPIAVGTIGWWMLQGVPT